MTIANAMSGRRMNTRLPPGPKTPGFVQLLQFAAKPHEFLEACSERYGETFTVDMAMNGTYVMVSTPALVKQVFTASGDVALAGKANRSLGTVVGQRSLLLLDGSEHLRHRRLLMPPFHGERMRTYAQIMCEAAHTAVSRMPVGVPFAAQPYMQSITLDVIARAVFGLEHGATKDRMIAAIVAYVEPPSPFLLFLPLIDLPLSPYRRFLRRREAVDREIHSLIAARRSGENPPKDDILSLLLAARDEAGEPLSDQELRDELVTALVAGHETISATLAWCFERLLAHPDAFDRLEAELATCDGPEALANAEYLDGFVKETLRTRTPLSAVVRELQAPITLGEWELPAGTRVSPCMHLAHHRADSWSEPRAFRPERFLGAKIDPYTWFPFGGGIRRCIGSAFALYETRIVLGTLLQALRLRRDACPPVRAVRHGVTISPEGGMRITIAEKRGGR